MTRSRRAARSRGGNHDEAIALIRATKPPKFQASDRGLSSLGLPTVGIDAILDAIRDVVMLVDAEGWLAYTNHAAQEMLGRRGPLRAERGRLRGSSRSTDADLRRAIERACSGEEMHGRAIVMHYPDQVPLVVVIRCLENTRHVLLLAFDSHPPGARLVGPLRECFGLTRSEAEVAAAIAEGGTIARIAERRGVAPGTIKSQIKTISTKLGCTRQSQIAAIVKAVPLAPQPRRS
jgi:DNA-binding CsgD family transcriptional regulator